MMTLLEFRARVRALYQKFSMYIDPMVKFLVALLVFTMINTSIGYEEKLTKAPVLLLLSLLCAFTPSSVLVLVAMFVSIAHIFKASMILAILVVLIFLVLYCFFLRYTPKYGYVVLAVPILFPLHLPYAIPILLGLIANPITILPTSCGVIVYFIFHVIKEEAISQTAISLDDTLVLYQRVLEKLLGNKQMIMTIIMFALIIGVVYVVRRLKIEYAYEIAIGAGAVTCILGFLIVDLRLDISKQIGTMVLGTIFSAIIVVIIQFFRRVLDYTAVENVQFEDDDYYYYVKAVPKINVSVPQIRVKRISAPKGLASEDDDSMFEDTISDVNKSREISRKILERSSNDEKIQSGITAKRYEQDNKE